MENRRVRIAACVLTMSIGCSGGQLRAVHYAAPMSRLHPQPAVTLDLNDVSPPWKRDPMGAVDAGIRQLDLQQSEERRQPSVNDVLRPSVVDGKVVLDDNESITDDDGPVAVTKDPKLIIREARQASYVEPNESHFENMDGDEYVYRYRKGLTYAVYACSMSALRIELAAGETLTTAPMIDDNRSRRRCASKNPQCETDTGWTISESPVLAGDGKGATVAHLYLRPNNEFVGRQYLHLATNIGPYRLRLEVLPNDDASCMTAVRWRHPQVELKRLQAEQARRLRSEELDDEVSTADDESRDITCASGQYQVQVAEGSPRWVPTQVSHVCVGDHPRVTIQFPREVAWTQWPAFSADGGVTGCRVIAEDYTIVCDHLFSGAMLALEAQGRSERVYIFRLKEPR